MKGLVIGFIIIMAMCILLIINNHLIYNHTHYVLQTFIGILLSVLIGISGMSTALFWFGENGLLTRLKN